MIGVIIEKGPADWQILQQENGFAKVELSGRYMRLRKPEDDEINAEIPKIYAMVSKEETGEPVIWWTECELTGEKWNIELNIHHLCNIRLFLFGMTRHQFGKSFAFNIIRNDRPFAVDRGNLNNLGDIESRFLHSRLVERLVEDIGLGIALVEHLDATVTVAVYGFVGSDCNHLIQFHIVCLPY